MKKSVLLSVLFCFFAMHLQAQTKNELDLTPKYFIGTSAFVLVNLVPNQENPPGFVQLNFGYRITEQDVLSVEAITWKYNSPLGIPYGSSYDDPDEAYPGYIREFGIGVAYQRFLWKGFYAGVHALPLYQSYVDLNDEKIQNGFELFLTFRLGYHIGLFNNRFFVEPSIAMTYWPINTNIPDEFKEIENNWPNYFLFEPGLHCGIMF